MIHAPKQMHRSVKGRRTWAARNALLRPPAIFTAPGALIYSILLVLPILFAVIASFTNWNGNTLDFDKLRFVGVDNYGMMFRDSVLKNSISVTLIITGIVVVAVNVLGFMIANLLKSSGRVTNIIRTVFFLPYVLSSIAVSFLWMSILSYSGLINNFLIGIGLPDKIISFFATRWGSIGCICAVEIWRTLGFYMVIYLAALQGVPQELYEACIVDGGSRWTCMTRVTLPMIVPQITVSVLMSIINELRIYEVIHVLTGGGPGTSTQSITFSIITQGFNKWRNGYASAIAVSLCVVIISIAVLSNRLSKKLEVQQ